MLICEQGIIQSVSAVLPTCFCYSLALASEIANGISRAATVAGRLMLVLIQSFSFPGFLHGNCTAEAATVAAGAAFFFFCCSHEPRFVWLGAICYI